MISHAVSASFPYSEAKFADAVGISRTDVKQFRKNLVEGQDWARSNGEIALALSAVKKIWRQLGKTPLHFELGVCAIENGTEKKIIALPPLDAPRQMRVTRITPNPYMVLARDDLGQNYSVRVPNNALLYLDLEISAVPDEKQPGFWQAVGPLPRFQGDRAYK